MRLEELLFCLLFFVVPVIGMFGVVIGSALKEQVEKKVIHKHKEGLFKGRNALGVPRFRCQEVMEYQMVESRVHIPLEFTRFKEKIHPRAGPTKRQ